MAVMMRLPGAVANVSVHMVASEAQRCAACLVRFLVYGTIGCGLVECCEWLKPLILGAIYFAYEGMVAPT